MATTWSRPAAPAAPVSVNSLAAAIGSPRRPAQDGLDQRAGRRRRRGLRLAADAIAPLPTAASADLIGGAGGHAPRPRQRRPLGGPGVDVLDGGPANVVIQD
jgi:hypothetical protein